MADLHVIEELHAYLVEENVGQDPEATVSDTIPRIFTNPRDGAPEPAAGEIATVTLRDVALMPAASLEAWLEEAFIDVIVRSRVESTGRMIHRAIRGLIVPDESLGGRKMWLMNDLLVEYSTGTTAEQPLAFEGDHDFYGRKAGFRFGCRRKVLSGLPYGTP